jgi:hypothetical protein
MESPQIPVLSALCPQLLNHPPPKKIPGYATVSVRFEAGTLYIHIYHKIQSSTSLPRESLPTRVSPYMQIQ